MKLLEKNFRVGGIIYGIGMFIYFMWSSGNSVPFQTVALIALLCAVGGLVFWAMMAMFMRVFANYSGTDRIASTARNGKERAFSLLAIPFAACPLLYVLAIDNQYLWPVLATNIPGFLLVAPLVSRPAGIKKVVVLTLFGVIGGALVGICLNQYLATEPLFIPNSHTLILLSVCSLSSCVSSLLSVYSNRSAYVLSTSVQVKGPI